MNKQYQTKYYYPSNKLNPAFENFEEFKRVAKENHESGIYSFTFMGVTYGSEVGFMIMDIENLKSKNKL